MAANTPPPSPTNPPLLPTGGMCIVGHTHLQRPLRQFSTSKPNTSACVTKIALCTLFITAWWAVLPRSVEPQNIIFLPTAATAPSQVAQSQPEMNKFPDSKVPHTGGIVMKCGLDVETYWYGRLGNNILSIFNGVLNAATRGVAFATKDCSNPILDLTTFDYDINNMANKFIPKDIITPKEAYYVSFVF